MQKREMQCSTVSSGENTNDTIKQVVAFSRQPFPILFFFLTLSGQNAFLVYETGSILKYAYPTKAQCLDHCGNWQLL